MENESYDDVGILENDMQDLEAMEEDYSEKTNMAIGSMFHGKPVYAVHFHNGRFFSGGEDDKVVAWKDALIWEHKFNDSVVEIKSSENKVAIACMDGDILVVDNSDEIKELYSLSGPNEIICLYFKKKIVMAGSQDGMVWVFKNDEVLNVLSGHSSAVTKLDTIDNSVISCSEDGTMIIWDVIQNTVLHKLDSGYFAHTTPIVSLIQLNGLMTGDVSGKIVMSNNCKVVGTIQHHQDSIECLSHYGNIVISADVSGKLAIWDLNTRLLRSSVILDTIITCMQVDEHFIYLGGADAIVRKFDILTGEQLFEFEGHTEQILCLLVTKDHILTGSDDGNSYVFLKDHLKYNELPQHEELDNDNERPQ